MYLSKLRIKNFRSIDCIDLDFTKGRNVILGRNNAGKSNIARAIDILLGENSPTYAKSEHITEDDFHKSDYDNPIVIFGVIQREESENFNFEVLKDCYPLRILSTGTYGNKNHSEFKLINELDKFWPSLYDVFRIKDDDESYSIDYIRYSKKGSSKDFAEFLSDKFQIGFAFKATRINAGKIEKDMRLLFRVGPGLNWNVSLSCSIRTELLQSAIIPSFRDPQSELKINQWSWFGKLLKRLLGDDTGDLMAAYEGVNAESDKLFSNVTKEINNSKINIAFPGSDVRFQFNSISKVELYKNTQIIVNDGHRSLLQYKGAGIQSALIIGLFHYYTRKISHIGASLLTLEEPELYLHPHARRVISNRLDDFLEGDKNQIIITTHSHEFICNTNENLNLLLISKDSEGCSVAKNTTFKDSKERQILLRTQNSEMFFANAVILVEGGEKYIVEAVARHLGLNVFPELGPNWIDDNNISIISTGGKHEFYKYRNKLNELGINNFIMADFDFLRDGLSKFLNQYNSLKQYVDEANTINGLIKEPLIGISEIIEFKVLELESLCKQAGITFKADNVIEKLRKKPVKQLLDVDPKLHGRIKTLFSILRKEGILVLNNELEDYYTEHCREKLKGQRKGKEEKPIYIVSELVTEEEPIGDYIKIDEYVILLEMVIRDLNIASTKKKVHIEVINDVVEDQLDIELPNSNISVE